MTHDPLCPDPDYPLPRKCVNCSLIRDTREDMLAKCIAAVEACGDDKGYVYSDNETGIEWALAALRALQEKEK